MLQAIQREELFAGAVRMGARLLRRMTQADAAACADLSTHDLARLVCTVMAAYVDDDRCRMARAAAFETTVMLRWMPADVWWRVTECAGDEAGRGDADGGGKAHTRSLRDALALVSRMERAVAVAEICDDLAPVTAMARDHVLKRALAGGGARTGELVLLALTRCLAWGGGASDGQRSRQEVVMREAYAAPSAWTSPGTLGVFTTDVAEEDREGVWARALRCARGGDEQGGGFGVVALAAPRDDHDGARHRAGEAWARIAQSKDSTTHGTGHDEAICRVHGGSGDGRADGHGMVLGVVQGVVVQGVVQGGDGAAAEADEAAAAEADGGGGLVVLAWLQAADGSRGGAVVYAAGPWARALLPPPWLPTSASSAQHGQHAGSPLQQLAEDMARWSDEVRVAGGDGGAGWVRGRTAGAARRAAVLTSLRLLSDGAGGLPGVHAALAVVGAELTEHQRHVEVPALRRMMPAAARGEATTAQEGGPPPPDQALLLTAWSRAVRALHRDPAAPDPEHLVALGIVADIVHRQAVRIRMHSAGGDMLGYVGCRGLVAHLRHAARMAREQDEPAGPARRHTASPGAPPPRIRKDAVRAVLEPAGALHPRSEMRAWIEAERSAPVLLLRPGSTTPATEAATTEAPAAAATRAALSALLRAVERGLRVATLSPRLRPFPAHDFDSPASQLAAQLHAMLTAATHRTDAAATLRCARAEIQTQREGLRAAERRRINAQEWLGEAAQHLSDAPSPAAVQEMQRQLRLAEQAVCPAEAAEQHMIREAHGTCACYDARMAAAMGLQTARRVGPARRWRHKPTLDTDGSMGLCMPGRDVTVYK